MQARISAVRARGIPSAAKIEIVAAPMIVMSEMVTPGSFRGTTRRTRVGAGESARLANTLPVQTSVTH